MCTGIIIHQNEIRTYSTAYGRTWTSKISLTYLSDVSVPLSMTCRSVFPWAPIPAHTITEPPPLRSCSAIQTSAKRSFRILQTLARLSVKSTQNLDSSVKRMWVQSLRAHVTWSRAHSKRSWTWCRVNGMRIAGRRDLKPASCNRFIIVCVLKRTPVAFCNSLRNVVEPVTSGL